MVSPLEVPYNDGSSTSSKQQDQQQQQAAAVAAPIAAAVAVAIQPGMVSPMEASFGLMGDPEP